MCNRRSICLLALTFGIALGAPFGEALAAPAAHSFQAKNLKLQRGASAEVTIRGKETEKYKSVTVLLDGKPTREITAKLKRGRGGQRKLVLTTSAKAPVSGNYQLQIETTDKQVRVLQMRETFAVEGQGRDTKGGRMAFRDEFRERAAGSQQSARAQTAKTTATDARVKGALDPRGVARVDLAPVDVSSFAPTGIAHPGMRLEFHGRGFDDTVVIRVGSGGTRASRLRILDRSATRIVADIPEDTASGPPLTGLGGAPLTVYQRHRAPRVLDPNFRVVRFDAVFDGVGRWHQSQQPTSGIFTTSRVGLRLDGFEFQDQGPGHYEETGTLSNDIDIESRRCDCIGDVCTGSQSTITNSFGQVNASRGIRWRRLSSGRVEISGVGLSHISGFQEDITTIGRQNGQDLTASFEFMTHSGPVRFSSDCVPLLERTSFNEPGRSGLPTSVQPTPKLVVWELSRKEP